MNKTIAFTGASGFIASSIQEKWLNKGFTFLKLKRNASDEEWKIIAQKSDVIINLAGAPVIQRWTKKNRDIILSSRIKTTRRLIHILNQLESNAPKLLISGSAIGIYPNTGEAIHDEYSTMRGTNFLTNVVELWENELKSLNNCSIRVAITRIGVVLGNEGGIIKKMKPVFKMGLGGKISLGTQGFSFIHIDDLINAFRFIIENEVNGIFNLVTPTPTNNIGFTTSFGKALKRPTFFPVPSTALYLVYGKSAEIMIYGEKVYPKRLLEKGFEFKFPLIDSALNDLCRI